MTKTTRAGTDSLLGSGSASAGATIGNGASKHVVLLNECTLFGIVALRMKGQVPYLFGIAPIFPPAIFLLRLAAWALRCAGWIKDIVELHEYAAVAQIRAPLFPSKDWFARTENLFVDQLGLEQRVADDEYDYAACKQAVNFGAAQLRIIHFVYEVKRAAPHLQLILHGWGHTTVAAQQLIVEYPDAALFLPNRYPRKLVNSGLTVLTAFSAILKVISQTKLRPAKRRRILLAIDVIDNLDRMVPAVNDILDDVGAQGLYIFRNRRSYQILSKGLEHYPYCPFPGGQYGIVDALQTMVRAVADCARLYRRFGAVDSELFLQVVKLSAVRVHFKGLFNKYDIANFWARDEYNAEHIIRSEELRRRGGRTIGLINGINVFGIDSVFRYIDHDLTFVFSTGVFLKYNSDNWRHPENVHPIGAIGLNRDEIAEMLETGKTPDIVCFAKTYCDGPDYLDQVFKIGRAFPERNVFVSLKKSATRLGGGDVFYSYLETAPQNVSLVDDPSFELIKKCGYVISGESSILSEAINLGSVSFFLDTYSTKEVFVYREYPFLSHRDGQTVIDLIKAIEDGSWEYPVGAYGDLADLSGVSAFDTIRKAIGLPPRDPPILAKIWQHGKFPQGASLGQRDDPPVENRRTTL